MKVHASAFVVIAAVVVGLIILVALRDCGKSDGGVATPTPVVYTPTISPTVVYYTPVPYPPALTPTVELPNTGWSH
jgi:hypothetical protein